MQEQYNLDIIKHILRNKFKKIVKFAIDSKKFLPSHQCEYD